MTYTRPALAAVLLALWAGGLPASNAMNPDLSVNGLFLYVHDSSPTAATTGLQVQEIEAQVASDIDPYFRGTAIVTMAPLAGGGWDIAPEEAYVETLGLPGLTLRAGKFRAALGRQNALHTHAYPFIDATLANQVLLGDGIDAVGLSAAWMAPTPWFVELTAQGFNASGSPLFNSPIAEEMAGLLTLKQLWDLSDAATLELACSWMEGRDAGEDLSQLADAAVTMKWRGDNSHALIVAGEYLRSELPSASSSPLADRGGLSAWAQWQFSRRWWLQGRMEALGVAGDLAQPAVRKYSALVALVPTEFSGLRLQYDWIEAEVNVPEHRIMAQLNFTMGVHPAHAY